MWETYSFPIYASLRIRSSIQLPIHFNGNRNNECALVKEVCSGLCMSVCACACVLALYQRVHIRIAQVRTEPAFEPCIYEWQQVTTILLASIIRPLLYSISLSRSLFDISHLVIVLIRKRNCHCCLFIAVLFSQAKIQFSNRSSICVCVCVCVYEEETKTEKNQSNVCMWACLHLYMWMYA